MWFFEWYSGIGIVNAIEVVNAFPEKDGLHEFREWIESPDPTILGKFEGKEGSHLNNKGSKDGDSSSNGEEISTSDQNGPQSVDGTRKIKQIFMDKHVTPFLLTFPYRCYFIMLAWFPILFIIYLSRWKSSTSLSVEKCEQKLAYSFFLPKWCCYFSIRISASRQVNRTFLMGKAWSFCSSQVSLLRLVYLWGIKWYWSALKCYFDVLMFWL